MSPLAKAQITGILLLLTACATPETPEGYDEALEQARWKQRSVEARRYRLIFHRVAGPKLGDLARRCWWTVQAPDSRDASFLIRIDATGKLAEAFVVPPTNVGQCVSQAAADLTFPTPPFPDFWIETWVDSHPIATR